MSRARIGLLTLLRGLSLLGVVGAATPGCGGPQTPGEAGSVCFRADDCRPGLACVPEAEGSMKHVCSSDLSGIVSIGDGGPSDVAGGGASGGAGAPAGAGSPASGGAAAVAGSA